MALWVAAMAPALARCQRPVQVPMSATGHSVVVDGEQIRGIYPELLQAMGPLEGCQFAMSAVPRARLEKLFETGKADMIVATVRSPRRDMYGIFIPMVRSRATLISLDDSHRPPFKSMQELLDNKQVRLVVVRGFDYGPRYHELLDALTREDRLLQEPDAASVARLMKANPDDVTLMVPTVLHGAMQEDARLSDHIDQLRVEPLENLPWGESGVYLSKTALEPALSKVLQAAFQRAARNGTVYKGFAANYPAQILKDSVKPLDRGTP